MPLPCFTPAHHHRYTFFPLLLGPLPSAQYQDNATDALAGVVVRALLFTTFSTNERGLKFAIGLLSLVFVGWHVVQKMVLGHLEKRPLSDNTGMVLGGIAGFSSVIAHAGGPPVAIYMLPQELSRDLFVGATVLFFTIVNLTKLIPYGILGLLEV